MAPRAMLIRWDRFLFLIPTRLRYTSAALSMTFFAKYHREGLASQAVSVPQPVDGLDLRCGDGALPLPLHVETVVSSEAERHPPVVLVTLLE